MAHAYAFIAFAPTWPSARSFIRGVEIDEIQCGDLSRTRGGDERALFLLNIAVKRRRKREREIERERERKRERERRESALYLDFMYASRRLYIALEAREGTISILFDKNKHCRDSAWPPA